jgi:hypothetical protein
MEKRRLEDDNVQQPSKKQNAEKLETIESKQLVWFLQGDAEGHEETYVFELDMKQFDQAASNFSTCNSKIEGQYASSMLEKYLEIYSCHDFTQYNRKKALKYIKEEVKAIKTFLEEELPKIVKRRRLLSMKTRLVNGNVISKIFIHYWNINQADDESE